VGQIELSAYGIVDAAIAYRYKRWQANLSVRNVLDEYAFGRRRVPTGCIRKNSATPSCR
jgi:outer membrane receptor protein involved in Fe transport